jgi:hypothetical protein
MMGFCEHGNETQNSICLISNFEAAGSLRAIC